MTREKTEATENGTRQSTASRNIGAALAILGALLMILVSWLSSLWTVPAIREGGTKAGGNFFGLWSISIPLGGILVVTGAALMSGVEKLRIWIMIGMGVLFFIWFFIGNISRILSPLFGIGGGIITAAGYLSQCPALE